MDALADADEIDFDGFLRLMRVDSGTQLEQYESRHPAGGSLHGAAASTASDLAPVSE